MNTLAKYQFDGVRMLRNAILFITSLGLAVFSSTSYSAYQYTYYGNTITGTFTQYHPDLPEPYNTPTVSEFTGAVFVQFVSPTLLTGPIDMANIDSFMMGGETTPGFSGNGSIIGNWVYPYPYQVPAYSNYGEFAINSVDANGLPTDWNIKMFGNEGYTRHTYYNFETTPYLDKIYGYSEYGSEWSGEIAMNPGQWKVTSVVPEPETYVMLLAGLGLVGFVYKRRRST
jgi:hypothetical protein